MYGLYRTLTFLAAPFVGLLLASRLRRGKEDPTRIGERQGRTLLPRPAGRLLWIHAASVGESNAVLPLIARLLDEHPSLHVLITTVTVTSAALLADRLPGRAFHQFAPVDTPAAVERFLDHWRPDVALWVDSELWPNLVLGARRRGMTMGLLNARLSRSSYQAWRFARPLARAMLAAFAFAFAQSDEDAARLNALGMRITGICNLKYDAPPLACDERELAELRAALRARPIWLAANTHPGEEEQIVEAHRTLKRSYPDVLTLIVPRHARRGGEIAHRLRAQGLSVAQRSSGEHPAGQTEIYLADTMGELGLFYRLAPVAFIGGSLVPHGGQNPLEAARLGLALLFGPHMENFAAMASELKREGAARQVDRETLPATLEDLWRNGEARAAMAARALAHAGAHGGAVDRVMRELRPHLAEATS